MIILEILLGLIELLEFFHAIVTGLIAIGTGLIRLAETPERRRHAREQKLARRVNAETGGNNDGPVASG